MSRMTGTFGEGPFEFGQLTGVVRQGTRESSALAAQVFRCFQRAFEILMTWKAEQATLNDCYFDKKDWRACKKEVS